MRSNVVTPYSRLLSIVFVFGIFPILVFYIGKKYQQTVSVLSFAQAAAYDLRANDMAYHRNTYSGTDSATVEFNLEGNWQSDQNRLFVFQVRDNNSFYDLYDGKPIASGAWLIRGTLDGTRFSNLGKGMYLEKNSLDDSGNKDVLYYKILSIDKDSLILEYLEKGNELKFTKKSSASTSQKVRSI